MAALIRTARAKRPKSRSTRWKLAGPRFVKSGRSFSPTISTTPALNRTRIASAATPGRSSTISTVFSVSKTSTTGMHSPATMCRRSGAASQVVEQPMDVLGEIGRVESIEPLRRRPSSPF